MVALVRRGLSMRAVTARATVDALLEHWHTWELPAFAQFDNDTRFQGPHQHPDAVGRVICLCLALDMVPVFTPPRETGFQAAIEGFNAQWQANVWARFHHDSLPDLQGRSARYIAAHHQRAIARIEAAPPRRPFPSRWRRQLEAPLRGHMVYLRRTSEHGTVPVAILSTTTFNATTVDPTTVTLAGAPVKLKNKGKPMASFEDVNRDGLLDLVVHVETTALRLSAMDTVTVLQGRTFDGKAIQGTDSVRVIP